MPEASGLLRGKRGLILGVAMMFSLRSTNAPMAYDRMRFKRTRSLALWNICGAALFSVMRMRFRAERRRFKQF